MLVPTSRSLLAATPLLALLCTPGSAQILGYPAILTAPRNCALAAGDLNGDGYLDLAVANRVSSVSICLGDGFGHGAVGTPLAVGSQPTAVAVEDLNGDGKLDVVTANYASNDVSVLLGTGSGTFGAATPYATALNPNSIAVADLNGDGKRDLVTSSASGSVSVLLGTGNGSFAAAVHYDAGASHLCVAVGDFNSDGREDVAVTNFPVGTVSVLLGRGNGALNPRTEITIGGSPHAIAVTDIDRDGKADLIVSNRIFHGEVIVLLGDGTGAFAAQAPVNVGNYPSALAVGDFNADGKDDVAVACDRPAVMLGDGAGGLGSPIGVTTYPSAGVTDLVVGDLDHDGRLDLVTNEGGLFDRVWVYPGIGSAFGTTARVVETEPWSVAIADMTGDGARDVVAANRSSSSVSVLANDGSGGFGQSRSYPVGAAPADVALDDLDGDGWVDAVTANSVAHTVSVLLNDGSGALRPPVSHAAGKGPFAVAIVDVDRDGRRDVVALASTSANVLVLLGNGAGGLGAATGVALPAGGLPTAFAPADFDRDGDLDLLVTLWSNSTLALLVNDGAGFFSAQSVFALGILQIPNSIAVGDVNGDGLHDAVVTGVGGRIAVLLGDGAGGFQTASLHVLPASVSSPVLADVNGDGFVDIAVTLKDLGSVSVMLGDGNGSFAFGTTHPTVVQGLPSELAAADLNGDAAPDLVAANTNGIGNAIAVLLGQGIVPFGTGTPGCAGMLGTSGATAARIGQPDFGLTVTNAPRSAAGTLMLATAPDVLGTTILGLKVHVFLPAVVINAPVASDAGGVAFLPVPIPATASLIGVRFFSQSLWIERAGSGRACGTALAHIVTSRGLAVTLLP